jgi:1,4-alpha-glucan branching enzyme
MLARTLAEGFAYQGEPSRHRGGHPRGEPSAHLPPTKFVDFLQNHDQIGNRAFGERITALAPHEAVKAAVAVLLLAPAIPLLFMGDEWAASTPFLFFSEFGPDLARAVTEGRRKEFAAWPAFADPTARERIPDPQDPATMRAATLDWDERAFGEHREMLEHYQRLLALRHGVLVPRLAHGVESDGYQVLGKQTIRTRWRFGDDGALTLVAHLGARPERVSYAVAGAPLYVLGDVPTRADHVALRPWSVGWFLAT